MRRDVTPSDIEHRLHDMNHAARRAYLRRKGWVRVSSGYGEAWVTPGQRQLSSLARATYVALLIDLLKENTND